MSKEEIVAAMDAVSAAAEARMRRADGMMIGLLPTASDWMTSEEMAEIHRLKLMLPSHGQEALEARERIRLKREARKQAGTL